MTITMNSVACIQRPPKGSNKSDLLQQMVLKCRFYYVVLTLPNDSILDLAKLKAFADDKKCC